MVTLAHRRKHHAWTPRSDSGLWIWHAADQQGGTDGAAVSQLTDLSGNGRHITTGANKPLYRASGVKGKPSFDFVGGRSIEQSITAFTQSNLAWFFAVKLSITTDAYGRIISCKGPSTDYISASCCIPCFLVKSGSNITPYGARVSQQIYTTGLVDGSEIVLSSVFGASRFDLYYDGVAGGGNATGGAFNFNSIEYGNGPFGENANSMLAEVFALTGTVDSTRRLLAENYLRTKYR